MPGRREKGPKQGAHKEALPQGQYTFHLHSLHPQKGLLFHVASSLKPLSHVYSRHITSPFVDKLVMNVYGAATRTKATLEIFLEIDQ